MTLIVKLIAEAALYLLCVAGTIFLLGAAYGAATALWFGEKRLKMKDGRGI